MKQNYRRGRPYVAAVVLGTALSAMAAPSMASAARAIPDNAISNLSRYCTACWRNARLPGDRWGDCTQEVLRRLLDRVQPENWDRLLTRETEERRELGRAIDAVKKRTLRDCRRYAALPAVVSDRRSLHEQERSETVETVRRASNRLLGPRQQSIIQLSLEGRSVQEIATELTLPPDRVSDEKYKAVRKLRSHFEESDVN